jgi:hypothetical protein
MDQEFYRQQTQRDLAQRADPFTKKRLLDLAYDVKGGGPCSMNRPSARKALNWLSGPVASLATRGAKLMFCIHANVFFLCNRRP